MLYQVVPPSQVVSTKISTLFKVLVSVGAVPPDHFTAVGHVTARAVPSAVNARVNPYAVLDAGIFENVMLVIAAFSETANTFPEAQLRASTPAEIAGAVLTSFNPVIVGVVSAGLVAKTESPVPVSSVMAANKFALDGLARNAETFVPSPLTPVEIGKPVQLVKVPDDGVPRTGVTRVGEVRLSVSALCNSWIVVLFKTKGYRAAMFSPR